jgi:peptidoglycan glycosyltransferase
MSGIANKGILPKPYLVDRIVSPKGEVLYKAQPAALRRLVKSETASKLLQMMEYTTTIGTSRREFVSKNRPILGNIDVAAKTGTLRGDNPEGINNWFIATAPIENPEIAVAVVVVHPSGISSRASNIGRQILQDYFK